MVSQQRHHSVRKKSLSDGEQVPDEQISIGSSGVVALDDTPGIVVRHGLVWEGQIEAGDVVPPSQVVPRVEGYGREARGQATVGGQRDPREGVEIEESLGVLQGDVRLVETHGQEERLGTVLPAALFHWWCASTSLNLFPPVEEADGVVGCLKVGQRLLRLLLKRNRAHDVSGVLVRPTRRSVLVSLCARVERYSGPAVGGVIGEVATDPRVENLARRSCVIAMLPEVLRESAVVAVLSPVTVDVHHTGGRRAAGGEEGGAAGATQRLLRECLSEGDPNPRQGVNAGRDGGRVPVTAEGRAQVVHHQQQHVGVLPRGGGGSCSQNPGRWRDQGQARFLGYRPCPEVPLAATGQRGVP